MTHIIEPHISDYIDKAVAKSAGQFQNRTDLAVEKFQKTTDLAVERFEKRTDLAVEEFQKITDLAVDNAHQKFKKEVEHHTGLLYEKFQSDLKLMGETVDLKIRETTREVIVEEVMPTLKLMDTKMNIFIEEMQVSREELKALRKDVNHHTVRITRLERATA